MALAALSCDSWQRDARWHFDLWIHGPDNPAAEVLTVVDTLHERGLRALALQPGETLRWNLDVGAEPIFQARPFSEGDCRLELTVVVDGVSHLLRSSALRTTAPAHIPPPFLTCDLTRWSGKKIGLEARLADTGTGTCRQVRLASPGLIERRQVERQKGQGYAPGRLNVVLISADTLRADALGFWGADPALSPAIDRLARRGDTFENAYATVNSTNPSFVSLMTGLYAKDHNVYDLTSALPASHETLIERFSADGYITRAVVAATHLGATSGLDQGVHGMTYPIGQFYGETVSNLALHFLQEPAEMPEPFFLWLHYFDAHVPHNPPASWAKGLAPRQGTGLLPVNDWRPYREVGLLPFDHQPPRFLDGHRQLYQAEVAYLDRQVERVLTAIEDQGLLDRTIVVFVADHGETLGERGNFFDHVGLHANTTRVPLIVLRPGQRQGRVFSGLVQHFDLFPTLLRLAGLPVPDAIDARDLYELGDKGRPVVFAEHANSSGAMIRTARHLYYRNQNDPLFPVGSYFYDLAADPGEETNLAGRGFAEEQRLAEALAGFLANRRASSPAIPVEVSPEEHDRLKALGYVN